MACRIFRQIATGIYIFEQTCGNSANFKLGLLNRAGLNKKGKHVVKFIHHIKNRHYKKIRTPSLLLTFWTTILKEALKFQWIEAEILPDSISALAFSRVSSACLRSLSYFSSCRISSRRDSSKHFFRVSSFCRKPEPNQIILYCQVFLK